MSEKQIQQPSSFDLYLNGEETFGKVVQEEALKEIINRIDDNCDGISEGSKTYNIPFEYNISANDFSLSDSLEDLGDIDKLPSSLVDPNYRDDILDCSFESIRNPTSKSNDKISEPIDLSDYIVKFDDLKKFNSEPDEEQGIYNGGTENFLGEFFEGAYPNLQVYTIQDTTLGARSLSNQNQNINQHHQTILIPPKGNHAVSTSKREKIFKISREDHENEILNMKKEYKKDFKTVILLLKQWYQIRGKHFSKANVIPEKVSLNAKQSAIDMGISKKTLDYYQLTIRKGIALQEKVNMKEYFGKSFGVFSKKIYSIFESLSPEEKEKVKKRNKSSQVKQDLSKFILEY